MPLNKSWHEYNESLIERGRILMDIGFLRSSNREIKNMNKGKVGAPFEYSHTYIQFLAFLKVGFKISYRIVQGIVRGLSDYIRIEEIHFTQIRRRILKIKPSVGNLNLDNNDGNNPITVIVDASGLTITKKGDYIEQKTKNYGSWYLVEIMLWFRCTFVAKSLFRSRFTHQKD